MSAIPLPVRLLLAFFACFQARELPLAWRDAPYEHFSGVALCLWLLPIMLCRVRRPSAPDRQVPVVFWFAVGLLTLKSLTGLNIAGYSGAALLIASLAQSHLLFKTTGPLFGLWLVSALLWMPVTGWGLSAIDPGSLGIARLLVIAVIALLLIAMVRKEGKLNENLAR